MTPKVYLAGPEVFLPDAVEVGRRKVAICARYGLAGLFPLDLDGPAVAPTSSAIFQACCAAMREADAVIANLTPFRGVGADPGTAFELGYMLAFGRPVFGYTNDPLAHLERVRSGFGPLRTERGQFFAADGYAVENFELFDNLMLAEALLAHGGTGVFTPAAPARSDPGRDLGTFERCVSHAAAALRDGSWGEARPKTFP
ncbi:nucleoside 2-deoxyribosyltransferase [Enterovirga aerilata]|uniref:Nucleoside 2-deoxyribosyltransferase n=1 Tax=Enterovirga aerilata TaxID=2730920 RepID=A0A849IDH6_9HYPH|nr:nucleoside 2-deoxyribosyltransferase [Enterovirga sp. DB1703]NNM71963.1 nucleoside 2-deoxyribosyltransferase [Enterovirga sp. DB1703]